MAQQVIKRQRYEQLDGIKGVICFFIIFVHYYNRTPGNAFPIHWLPDMLVEKGWMFVEFFFIISGFLFASAYKDRIAAAPFGSYVLARLKRLYPSTLLIAGVDVLYRITDVLLNGANTRMTLSGILRTLTFAETWIYNGEPFPTVVWYIHALFLCYIVYYFIGKSRSDTGYLSKVIALLLFGWVLYVKQWSIPFLYRNIGRGYMAFSVGLLIFEFQNRVSDRLRRRISVGAMVLSVLTLGLGCVTSFSKVFGDMLLSYTLFLFPTAMLCLLNLPWVAWIFSRRPLVWLGKISMATFLVHVPVMNFIQAFCYRSGALPFTEPSTFVIVLAAIFAAAIGWHYGIEKKLIPGLLRRLEGGK